MLNAKEIEELEKRYLNDLVFFIKNNLPWLLERLKSKNEIKSDWLHIFKVTSREAYNKASELDKGAERVMHNLFGQYRGFVVNSAPIGSDLMFETPDAFVHIEIKTATDSNPADFKGKIQIAQNQTSYSLNKTTNGEKYPFKASLPKVYDNGKLCLTYVIQIIHRNDEDLPKIIFIYSIPNGELKGTYNNCVNAGKHEKKLNKLKSRGDIRFLYRMANKFENLAKKPSRIKIIYPTNPTQELIKEFLDLDS